MARFYMSVPPTEYERWEKEKPKDEEMEHWVRRSINWMLSAEIEGTTTITLRRRKLIREIGTCVRCGAPLRTRDVRARYCGDRCRVAAWRERKAAGDGKPND